MTIENYSTEDLKGLVSKLKNVTYFLNSGDEWPDKIKVELQEQQCELVEMLESRLNFIESKDLQTQATAATA